MPLTNIFYDNRRNVYETQGGWRMNGCSRIFPHPPLRCPSYRSSTRTVTIENTMNTLATIRTTFLILLIKPVSLVMSNWRRKLLRSVERRSFCPEFAGIGCGSGGHLINNAILTTQTQLGLQEAQRSRMQMRTWGSFMLRVQRMVAYTGLGASRTFMQHTHFTWHTWRLKSPVRLC